MVINFIYYITKIRDRMIDQKSNIKAKAKVEK